MYFNRDLDVLSKLARRRNPFTDQPLPKSDIVNNQRVTKSIIRLYNNYISLSYQEYFVNNMGLKNTYKRWDKDEEAKLIKTACRGESIKNLSISFGRSEGAITRKLYKLGYKKQ